MTGRVVATAALVFSVSFVGTSTEEAGVRWPSSTGSEALEKALEFTEVVPDVYRVRRIGALPTELKRG